MVRIEFLGAWKDKDVQAVRDVTGTGIEKNTENFGFTRIF